MVAGDPTKVQALNNSILCADFLTLIFNNMTQAPTRNVNREVARRDLVCSGPISAQPMMSFFDDTKYSEMTPNISSKIMSDLKSGNDILDCTDLCAGAFIKKESDLYALDIAENWKDLALEVARIGNHRDLAYYYLGQAAQGLGYHTAAIKYYTSSLAIAAGPENKRQCATEAMLAGQVVPFGLLNNQARSAGCSGVDIPSVVPVLIQASRDELARGGKLKPVEPPAKSSQAEPPGEACCVAVQRNKNRAEVTQPNNASLDVRQSHDSKMDDLLSDGVKLDVSLPDDAKILPPSADVPHNIASYSGVWIGRWGGELNHILVVENINPIMPSANIIYAWGDSSRYHSESGWNRGEARFDGNTLVYTNGSLIVTYVPQMDGSLAATYNNTRRGWHANATMTKRSI
jgi:hypothetical protein